MRIVLTGAPGSQRGKIAQAVAERLLQAGKMNVGVIGRDMLHPDDLALGLMADYRTEMYFATHRVMDMTNVPDDGVIVYASSLLDSVAYVAERYANMVDFGSVSQVTKETWAITLLIITRMLVDTFKADHVFHISVDHEEDSESARIDARIRDAMNSYNLSFTVVPDLKAVEEIATLVEGELDSS